MTALFAALVSAVPARRGSTCRGPGGRCPVVRVPQAVRPVAAVDTAAGAIRGRRVRPCPAGRQVRPGRHRLSAASGLRCDEVAVLRLDDTDWQAGRPGSRQRKPGRPLPVPTDLGQAIVATCAQEDHPIAKLSVWVSHRGRTVNRPLTALTRSSVVGLNSPWHRRTWTSAASRRRHGRLWSTRRPTRPGSSPPMTPQVGAPRRAWGRPHLQERHNHTVGILTMSRSTSAGSTRMMRGPLRNAGKRPTAMRRRNVRTLMPVRSAAALSDSNCLVWPLCVFGCAVMPPKAQVRSLRDSPDNARTP